MDEKYFSQPGDLSDSPKVKKEKNENLMDKYFMPASEFDLTENSFNEIESEFGSMIVSREKLDKMIDEGYNITNITKVGDLYSIDYNYESAKGRSR